MFHNRSHAGIQLANRLRKYHDDPEAVILAVPRGGVPVAYEVALQLNLPMDLVMIKKLGHPLNKEFAIGAVGLNDHYIAPMEDVSEAYVERQVPIIRDRLKEMQRKFLGTQQAIDIRDKKVIIIDDGVATGNTLLLTIRMLKKAMPSKIIVAVPVASRSAARKIKAEVDDLVTVFIPDSFVGVGGFYRDFSQTKDEEVIECIQKLNEMRTAS